MIKHGEVLEKPLFRGWFHAVAAVVSLGVIAFLCLSTRDDLPRMLSVLVFGLSTLILYGVSAIYHLFDWGGLWKKIWRTFDHANIFLLIAGTYTPICFNLLSGWVRGFMLALIWFMAIIGIIIAIFGSRLSRWLRTTFYLGMGWVSMLTLPALLAVLPWYSVGILVLGGVLYSIGAVIYALRKPDPFPRYFGFHEIFHIFVIAGGLAFTIHITIWVLPYPRI